MMRGSGFVALLVLGALVALKESGSLRGLFAKPETERAVPKAVGGKYDEDRSNKPKRSREDLQRMADRWYQEILEKHPEMKVTFKEVPDERNGFLQLLNFMDRYAKDGLPIPENISEMISGHAPWDAAVMGKWVEENRGLMDEIVKIGLLDERSAKGIDMDRTNFFSAKVPNECSKLLLASARLAMERGDEAGALQSARAVFGLADHMDRMELPSLLSETVSVLLRQGARKAILSEILGAGGGTDRDLTAWQDLLAGDPETPADLARIFLGEWHNTTRSFLLPGLLGDQEILPMLVDSSKEAAGAGGEIRDPDSVVEAHLKYFSGLMAQMKASELGEIPGLSANPPDKSGVSPAGGALLDELFVGATAWSKGWTRAQTDAAIYQAALLAATGGEMPVEPFTGKPFIVDEEAGTIRVPEDPWFESMNYKPVKIPVVRGSAE
ncbi:hypothetical protein [Luteolibacter soli]|uniref:Uncharacterized protein n=1 Tax=Luteolibacter soli TaxID=3135280 RepID=A0ABU9AXU4_9BACT